LLEPPSSRLTINLPVCAVVLAGSFRLLTNDGQQAPIKNFDALGAILSTAGMVGVVYALVNAPTVGWGSTRTISDLVAAIAVLGLFVIVELRHRNPLFPLSIFRIKGIAAANATQVIAQAGFYSMFFFITLYTQNVLVVSVLRSLGYKARLRTVPHPGVTWRPNRQAGVGGWGWDFPAASNFFVPLFTCRSYASKVSTNENWSEFCNRHIDAEVARATVLQTVDPPAASRLWTKIDHEMTDLAPWVVIRTGIATDFVSDRTGNYTSCWLSYVNGSTAACLDQLWVR
jgi:hypothetical protein